MWDPRPTQGPTGGGKKGNKEKAEEGGGSSYTVLRERWQMQTEVVRGLLQPLGAMGVPLSIPLPQNHAALRFSALGFLP